jgi:uncharacterized membrane protein YhaH (DUF805 family)
MTDVFISYAREDRAQAELVARGLSGLGLEVFWDTDVPPGRTWADFIQERLTGCKAVVVLWSATSARSQWVREEARVGRDRALLIPAMIDGTPAPFGFGEVQAADLSTWRGEGDHAGWLRFAHAVQAAVARHRDAPASRQMPPPPSIQSKPASGAGADSLSPVDYVRKCLQLYFNANGRARRAEYWWWVLFTTVAGLVAGIIDGAMFGWGGGRVLSGLLGLALLSPGICVTIRRFHDVGLSGWFVAGAFAGLFLGLLLSEEVDGALGGLVILAAFVATLVITVLPSKPGPNKYGPNPKGA